VLTTLIVIALVLSCLAVLVQQVCYGSAVHRALNATTKADREHAINVLKIAKDNRSTQPIVVQLPGRRRSGAGEQQDPGRSPTEGSP
jgi:anionic cell wall polymer biosynthesis LytR-Cps2A-Psr (LCP) family protein